MKKFPRFRNFLQRLILHQLVKILFTVNKHVHKISSLDPSRTWLKKINKETIWMSYSYISVLERKQSFGAS